MTDALRKVSQAIESVYSGQSLKKILKATGISPQDFYEIIAANPELDNRYMRAQKGRSELLADEIIDIVDSNGDPQVIRNRMEGRKWYASKMYPSKFGDRIDLNVNQTIDIRSALDSAVGRIRDVVDMTAVQQLNPTGLEPDASTVVEKGAPKSITELLE